MNVTGQQMVRVWDPFVRIAHWVLVVAFFVAYLTEDDFLTTHVWAGYVVGAVVVLRVIWGLIGPRHARFGDFVYRPAVVLGYVGSMLSFHPKRYLGHNPAGGVMVVIMLLSLAATVWSGLEVYAVQKQAGPLAGWVVNPTNGAGAAAALLPAARADDDGRDHDSDSAWKDIHEFLANLTLILVLVHIGGVILASLMHQENLAKAMVTGLKRNAADSAEPIVTRPVANNDIR